MIQEDDKDFDLISAYFDLELSDKEMVSFEERLNNDAFAQKVRLYKKSLDIVDDAYNGPEHKIRHKKWKEIITQKSTPSKVVRLRWISTIAASIIIFITIYLYYPARVDYHQLSENAWNKKVGLDFVVRNTSENKKMLISALEAFEKESYDSSLTYLKEYDSTSTYYKDVLLLRALSNHKMNRTEYALKMLDTLNKYNPSIVQWYKGLIYLDTENIEKAKNYVIIPKNSNEEIKLKK